MTKWNTASFLENRLFDSRLTKSSLVNKWRIDDDIYNQRMDFRSFKETYVKFFELFHQFFSSKIIVGHLSLSFTTKKRGYREYKTMKNLFLDGMSYSLCIFSTRKANHIFLHA